MKFDSESYGSKYVLSILGIDSLEKSKEFTEEQILDSIEKVTDLINKNMELWDLVNEIDAQLDIKEEFNSFLEVNRQEADSVENDLAQQIDDGERADLTKALSRIRDDNQKTQKEVDEIDSKLDSIYEKLKTRFDEYQISIGTTVDHSLAEDIRLKLEEFGDNLEKLLEDLSDLRNE